MRACIPAFHSPLLRVADHSFFNFSFFSACLRTALGRQVAVEELRFGDNDTLSALVASLVRADWLFMLTDVDAMYTVILTQASEEAGKQAGNAGCRQDQPSIGRGREAQAHADTHRTTP